MEAVEAGEVWLHGFRLVCMVAACWPFHSKQFFVDLI